MSSILQKQQLRSSRSVEAFSSQRRAKLTSRKSTLIVRAGLFNFLSQPAPVKNSARANELVDELFAITRNTDAGAKLSEQKRQQVKELVQELSQYCPRSPLRSKLLFGTYEVLFAFKKDATGGTLRSGAGPILFPGQQPSQTLEQPNIIINRLDFKTLGFLPGYGQQTGTFTPLNADTFELKLTQRQINTGFGSEKVADIDFVRKIQILYLDERCRVARFVPEAVEGSEAKDDLYFVFERIVEKEAAQPVEAEAPVSKGTTIVPLFGSQSTKPGLATLAERKVREQLAADAQGKVAPAARGTSMVRVGTGMVKAKSAPVAVGTGIVKAKPAPVAAGRATAKGVDPRVAAAEKKRAEAEAAKAKAREEQERAKAKQREAEEKAKREEAAREAKARAEAERKAKQERLVAVKDALSKLGAELQAAQVASRQAKVELRDVEKETQSTNKKTADARAQLEAAVSRTQSASNELQAAIDARNSAQAEVKQAQATLKETEKKYREQLAVAGKR